MLGALVFGLGVNVSLHRMKLAVSVGHDSDPDNPLSRARVAHSNACEYCPMFAVLMLCTAGGKIATGFAVLAVVARYAHAFGMITRPLSRPNRYRYYGSLFTYVSGLGLSFLLLSKHL